MYYWSKNEDGTFNENETNTLKVQGEYRRIEETELDGENITYYDGTEFTPGKSDYRNNTVVVPILFGRWELEQIDNVVLNVLKDKSINVVMCVYQLIVVDGEPKEIKVIGDAFTGEYLDTYASVDITIPCIADEDEKKTIIELLTTPIETDEYSERTLA